MIRMTRDEYEAKYGQKPAISSTQPINQGAPIKMTRAEYEAKYGTPVNETEGVWDAVKTGFSNAKQAIVDSGEELANVLATPTNGVDGNFAKTVKASTTLIKAPIKVGAELALATPARMIGEGIESTTGYDINEAVAQGTKKLVQKGMDTETAKKAMDGWAKLKETDPEAAMALSAVLDIGDIVANVVGLGAEKAAIKTAVGSATKGAIKTGEKVAEIGGKVYEAGAKAAGGVMPVASRATEFGVSQTFGLKPETIRNIVKNPEMFTPEEMASFDKHSISNKVFKAIDKLENEYGETGKVYESVRNTTGKVNIPKTAISDVLNKYGIQLDDAGKIIHNENSVPMSTGDINQLQNWINTYAKTEIKNPNQFMNARQASGKIANFNAGTTDVAGKIGRDLYAKLNEIGRPQIKGLTELDAKYSPLRDQYKNIKKDYFDKYGNLKDNAYSKLFNLTGKNKERVLSRVEKIAPGITEDLNILKSMEDIAAAGSNKVGTYTRTIVGTGGGALLGGLPGAVAGMILTSPQMGVKLIRTYGKLKKIKVDGVINKMKAGKKLIDSEIRMVNDAVDNAAKNIQEKAKKITPGMSLQDVSKKNLNNPLIQEARKQPMDMLTGKERKLTINSDTFKPRTYSETPKKGVIEYGDFPSNGNDAKTVNAIMEKIKAGERPPVLVGKSTSGKLMVSDGNHTLNAYKKLGIKDIPVIEKKSGILDEVSQPLQEGVKTAVSKNPLIQEARKYKSAEEFVKNQQKVYHGTNNPKLEFKDAVKSSYADERMATFSSSDKQVAESFGKNIHELTPNLKNPLVIDAKKNNYYDIPIPKELRKDIHPSLKTIDTDSIVEIAQEKGHDGVIIKNVIEGSGEYDPADARDLIVGLKKDSFLTKQQLTDIWNKSQPLQEVGKTVVSENKPQIINPDLYKEKFKDYNPANHEKYSQMAKEEYQSSLKTNPNPIVKFTMGGSGSGKSEFVLPRLSKDFNGIILDGTGAEYKSFSKKLQQAKDAGKQIEIGASLPDITTAWKFAQRRALRTGRNVPLDEFLRMHSGFVDTLKKVINNFPDAKIKLIDSRGLSVGNIEAFNTKTFSNKEKILKILDGVRYDKNTLKEQLGKLTPVKVVMDEFSKNISKPLADINAGGTTYDIMKNKGLGGKHYTAVSIYPERSKVFSGGLKKADILQYVRDNLDLLSQKNHTLGGWYDTEAKKLWLDVAGVVKKTRTAVSLGKQFNQKAVFNLKKFEEIPTGGTGENIKNLPSIQERINLLKNINK